MNSLNVADVRNDITSSIGGSPVSREATTGPPSILSRSRRRCDADEAVEFVQHRIFADERPHQFRELQLTQAHGTFYQVRDRAVRFELLQHVSSVVQHAIG